MHLSSVCPQNLLHKHSQGVHNGVDSENLPNGDASTLEDEDDDDNPESILRKSCSV